MPKTKDIVVSDTSNLAVVTAFSEEDIRHRIYTVRGKQVMFDHDLAVLFQVETKVLNQAVKRNIKRFPERYMFQLTKEEWESLRSQFVTTNTYLESVGYDGNGILRSQNVTIETDKRGRHTKYLPFVFTEQGVSQLSSVLNSDVAIEMSIRIIDAFVAMRQMLAAGQLQGVEIAELRARIEKLEQMMEINQETTAAIKDEVSNIYQALNALSAANQQPLPEVGYTAQRYQQK